MRRLEGKVAIVTGGGGGIGSAVARRIVQEGGRVAIADVFEESARNAAEPLGDAALAVQFDAIDPASIEAMVNATVDHFGGLDILHNNAAMTDPEKHPQDTTPVDIPIEIWDEIISSQISIGISTGVVSCGCFSGSVIAALLWRISSPPK